MTNKKIILILLISIILNGCVSKEKNDAIKNELIQKTNNIDTQSIANRIQDSANAFFHNGDYEKSAAIYYQLFSMHPENKECVLMLAESKRMLHEFDAALSYYEMIINSEEYKQYAIEGKVLILTQQGEFIKAIDVAISYSEMIDSSWKILNAIAIAYASNNNMEKAEIYYKKAIESGGSNPAIMNNIALSMTLTGQIEKGIELFNQILSDSTLSEKLRKHISLNLALAYSMNKNLSQAEKIASQYLKGRELYNNMGVYSHIAYNNKMANIFLNKALNQSTVHYSKAWHNINTIKQ